MLCILAHFLSHRSSAVVSVGAEEGSSYTLAKVSTQIYFIFHQGESDYLFLLRKEITAN